MTASAPAMTSGGLIKTSVQLAPDQIEAIDAFADRNRLSRSGAIKQLVDLGLEQQRKRDQLLAAVG